MKVSAGVAIVLNKEKVLLCHPSNASWGTNYSFPKGGVDIGEGILDAAMRELREETSVIVSKSQIKNPKNPHVIDYINRDGSIYKRIYLFQVDIKSIREVGLTSEVIDKSLLQIEEVDWAGFVDKEEASLRIFWKSKKVLNDLWN